MLYRTHSDLPFSRSYFHIIVDSLLCIFKFLCLALGICFVLAVDDELNPDLTLLLVAALLLLLIIPNDPIPIHNSVLTGSAYYHELCNMQNMSGFRALVRMDKQTFDRLIHFLATRELLHASRNICCGQKLMIFIWVVAGHNIRYTANRWQHSISTISDIVHKVADAMMSVRHILYIKPDAGVPAHIMNSPKFYPYFKDCIGCWDGSHIPAVVNAAAQGPYRNRKGFISQNVLTVVNFQMIFQYILAGWEGSAHDSRVLDDAMGKGLPLIDGKYFLGDAGYGITKWCLVPYRGVRYHLKEWGRGNQKPLNKEELFNLRHSSLRNVVERSLGVVKKRFPLLEFMLSYPYEMQVK